MECGVQRVATFSTLVGLAFAAVAQAGSVGWGPWGPARPPPLAVSGFLLLGRVGAPGLILGALFHGCLFGVLNFYLVLRRRGGHRLSPRRATLPTQGVLSLVGLLALAPWALGLSLGGLSHQGRSAVVGYGLSNALLLGLSLAGLWGLERRARDRRRVSDATLLWIHFAAHLSALTALLPWLGRAPTS